MRRDLADVVDPEFDVQKVDADALLAEAKAKSGNRANWRDDTEPTSIAPPLMISQFLAAAKREGSWDPESSTPMTRRPAAAAPAEVPPVERVWDEDDEAEPTQALDLDRLAPWYVPEAPELPGADASQPRIESALNELVEPLDHSSPFGRREEPKSHTAPIRARQIEDDVRPRRTSGVREIQQGESDDGEESRPKAANNSFSRSALAAAAMRAARAARRGREHIWGPFDDAPEAQPSTAAPEREREPALEEILAGKATIPARGRAAGPVTFSDLPRSVAPVLPPSAANGPKLAERVWRAGVRNWLWMAAGALVVIAIELGLRSQPVETSTSPVTVTPVLANETGFLATSEPPGAQIFVDGKATGLVTPARVLQLTPGLHAAEFKLAGHFDTSVPVVLRQGAISELSTIEMRTLEPEEKALVGAQVDQVDQIQPKVAEVAPEPKAVEVQPEPTPEPQPEAVVPAAAPREVKPAVERVRRKPVAHAPRPAAAERGEGVLQITSRPWARVYVDDKLVGDTPQRALQLRAGLHVVRLVNEQLNMSKTLAVEIRNGETLSKVVMLNLTASP